MQFAQRGCSDASVALTDVLAIGHHGVVSAQATPGSAVVVVGDGAVGLSCTDLAAVPAKRRVIPKSFTRRRNGMTDRAADASASALGSSQRAASSLLHTPAALERVAADAPWCGRRVCPSAGSRTVSMEERSPRRTPGRSRPRRPATDVCSRTGEAGRSAPISTAAFRRLARPHPPLDPARFRVFV